MVKIDECIGFPYKNYFLNYLERCLVTQFPRAFTIGEDQFTKYTFLVEEGRFKDKIIKFKSESNINKIKTALDQVNYFETNFKNNLNSSIAIFTENDHKPGRGRTRLMFVFSKLDIVFKEYIYNSGFKHRIGVLYDVSTALKYLHVRRGIHRNVNPHSIFVQLSKDTSKRPRGYLRQSASFKTMTELSTHSCGTGYLLYRAPEMIPKEQKTVSYDISVDIWAFGLVLFEAIFGCKPNIPIRFNTNIVNNMKTFANDLNELINELIIFIEKGQSIEKVNEENQNNIDFFLDNSSDLEKDAKINILKILQGCVQVNPLMRYTAEGLNNELFDLMQKIALPTADDNQNELYDYFY